MGKKKQAPKPAHGAASTSSAPAAQPTGATKRPRGQDPTATLQPPWLPGGRPRRQGLRAPHAQDIPSRPGPPHPTRSPTSPHEDPSANPCSTTPIAGPVRSQALQTRPTRGAARSAATTPGQESHQDVSHGRENQTQGQGENARGKATAGEGATGGKDSQHPIEPRKDGTEEQGDAGAEAAGEKGQPEEEERERREGLRRTARSKGKAPMEEAPTVRAQEMAQGPAGFERESAQAEGASGAAESAGEEMLAEVQRMAAGQRAHEEDGMA
ncbi:unnamed protein product [Closterium sp. Naga37s-1]|nr:unnamed protein product [Closterium sp. Naga37s-1]